MNGDAAAANAQQTANAMPRRRVDGSSASVSPRTTPSPAPSSTEPWRFAQSASTGTTAQTRRDGQRASMTSSASTTAQATAPKISVRIVASTYDNGTNASSA